MTQTGTRAINAKFTLSAKILEQHLALQRLVLLDIERSLIIERLTHLTEGCYGVTEGKEP